jgi:hypothetical protein
MARGMRVSYAKPERVEGPVPEVHSVPALERVHGSGSKIFASGRVDETETEEALCSGFSKQDLVVTFETETEEALRSVSLRRTWRLPLRQRTSTEIETRQPQVSPGIVNKRPGDPSFPVAWRYRMNHLFSP